MAKSRQAVVNLVESWDGKKESNGSHKSIIDLYNDFFEKICAANFPVAFVCAMTGLGALAPGLH